MLPTGSSLLSGIASVVLIAALLGTVAGLAFSGTDLLNFNTSAAQARAIDHDTQIKSQKDAVDLENYKAIKVAQTEAELQKIQLGVEAHKRSLELQVAAGETIRQAQIWLGVLVVIAITMILSYCSIRYAQSHFLFPKVQSSYADPKCNPALRAEIIRQARAQEVAERQAQIAAQFIAKSTAPSGNGRHPSKNKLPLAM